MTEKEFTWDGYAIFVADKFPKKYYALIPTAVLRPRKEGSVRTKKVYFGDIRYEHYKDKLGYYKDLDHNNNERRRLFKKRMEKNRHKKESPGWFADQILW